MNKIQITIILGRKVIFYTFVSKNVDTPIQRLQWWQEAMEFSFRVCIIHVGKVPVAMDVKYSGGDAKRISLFK